MRRVASFLFLCALAGCGGGGTEAAPAGGGPAPVPPLPPVAGPSGAMAHKTGPIRITPDGTTVWLVNTDNHSVTRIDATTGVAAEFPLPGADSPRTLAVTDDGSEVLVACHDTDRVHVLAGDGALLATIALPWGSGPHGVVLSPDGATALVTLHRSGAVAEVDRAARSVRRILPVWQTPLGIAFEGTGLRAWVTHLLPEGGEHPRLTRLDLSGGEARVLGTVTAFATDPRASGRLAAPHGVAEGGYLSFRGHLAPRPGVREMWLPTQYSNIHEDRFSPDSTVQATVRRLRLDDLSLPNTTDTKVILSARFAHDPANGNPYLGPGWNAGVAGAVDLAFSADGTTALVLCELSNDVVVLPADTRNVRPDGAPPLAEIAVGDRPVGIAWSPRDGAAWVANRHSRDVSVIDVANAREIRRIPATPVTGEPFPDEVLRGAKLFHSSTDPRASSNGKVACASCHVDGDVDGRHWGFHALAGLSGPRPTLPLRGLSLHFGPRDLATGLGQLHVSGDRDEVQDFDLTFRSELMGGTGFLAAPAEATAGKSADLDALARYLLDLPPVPRSPFRAADGALTERAVRGARHFLDRCASCHVPETGFQDFTFHDVGQRRPNEEEELGAAARGAHRWKVKTRSLVGLFATPDYDGVAGFADDIDRFLEDIAGRTSHGDIRALNGQERGDLAEFLLSIDGNMTAAEVRGARDLAPPRVVRAEPASLSRIDVWFSEPVTQASAESLPNWEVGGAGGPVQSAVWDPGNGDRVTLAVALAKGSFTLTARGISDAAGNAMAEATVPFAIGDTLTITLGASGYENVTIPVHDAATVGPNLATWSHDAPWLSDINGNANKGFVRFEWRDALAALGVASSADILDAAIVMHVDHGYGHPVEARRCLRPWSDPAAGGDWNQDPVGGPTWRDHSHPGGRWNLAGARKRTAGVEGRVAADYGGSDDTAFTPDATAAVDDVTAPVVLGGAGVTDAFRFWFDNPSLDHGYVLQFAPGAPRTGLKLLGHERGGPRLARRSAGEGGSPLLSVSYRVP